ncbi:MAG TPA: hypothetical protein VJS13_03950 [Pyrinomonadaceae bacterium]|nr:hypothetical protein [Pyrinomonadaceae bacterium]
MKIAVVSESPTDEAAVKILVDAILGHETELVAGARLRPHGWPNVLTVLPPIIKALHYRAEADALAVVVDSDDSPLHDNAHDQTAENDCRLCQLRNSIALSFNRLSPVANRAFLKTAIGIAVPAIEAWYRCGTDPHVMEATWHRRLQGERITYDRRSLKADVYGSDQPGLAAKTTLATEAAKRLGNNLELLEKLFPLGFGCFICDVRTWRV